MKVIFLDIDGVLNCEKTPNPRKFPYVVDKKLLARLQKLLERTGAKVVLSSSWRLDPIGLFAAKHWRVPFMDVCPICPEGRRDEVLTWIARRQISLGPVIDGEDDSGRPLFQPSCKTSIT
jgi:hypothetical protein